MQVINNIAFQITEQQRGQFRGGGEGQKSVK